MAPPSEFANSPAKPGRRPRRVAAAPVSLGAADSAARLLAAPPAEASAEPKRRRRATLKTPLAGTAGPDAAPIPVLAPATAAEPPADGFRDLLGQAVGLRLDAAGRTYRTGRVEVTALAGASLQIAPGEFVAIMGPSGCGKSTLLNLVGGLDRPTSGRVFAAGVPLDQLSSERVAEYRLQRVGSIFQGFNLMPELSVTDNVALPLALAGVPMAERAARVAKLLELVSLEDRARFRPGRLSGGEQQRVAVARALANRPGLILADEPTGSLDSEAGERVLALLEEAHRLGATVVLVTHDPAVAKRAARVITMRDGRLLAGYDDRRVEHAPLPLESPGRLDRAEAALLAAGRVAGNLRSTAATGLRLAAVVAVMTILLALSAGLHDRFLGALTLVAAAAAILTALGSAGRARSGESGVLRALGAAAGDLRLLFAAEAALLGMIGGIAGLAVAALTASAAAHLPAALASRIGPSSTLQLLHLTPVLALAGLGFAIVVSAIGGLIPAVTAARQDAAGLLRSS